MSVGVSEVRCVEVEEHGGRDYYEVYEEEVKDIVENNDLECHGVRRLDYHMLYIKAGEGYSSSGITDTVLDVDKVVFCCSNGCSDNWFNDEKDSIYSYYVYNCSDVFMDSSSLSLKGPGVSKRMDGVVMSVYQKIDLDDLISKETKTEGTTNPDRIYSQEVISDCGGWKISYGEDCIRAAYHKCQNRGFIRGVGEFEDYSEWLSASVSENI
jgi:hypothetical protein